MKLSHKLGRVGRALGRFGLAMAAGVAVLAAGSGASALETVEVRYGQLGISTSMDDIEAFALGEPTSPQFRTLVRQISGLSGLEPEEMQAALTQEISLSDLGVDTSRAINLMYGFLGERLLERVSQIMSPPLNRGNYFALRGAIVTSLADDGAMSPLEVLQNYGPRTVRLDAALLQSTYQEVIDAIARLQ